MVLTPLCHLLHSWSPIDLSVQTLEGGVGIAMGKHWVEVSVCTWRNSWQISEKPPLLASGHQLLGTSLAAKIGWPDHAILWLILQALTQLIWNLFSSTFRTPRFLYSYFKELSPKRGWREETATLCDKELPLNLTATPEHRFYSLRIPDEKQFWRT